MNGIFSYLKSYVILFLVLTILLEMVPKAGMQKYIRFFSQMILVFGLLYPVLGWMGESDAFLEKIEYQSFLQKMEEVQSDAEKITYLDNDHYVKKYEDAIAPVSYTHLKTYFKCVRDRLKEKLCKLKCFL